MTNPLRPATSAPPRLSSTPPSSSSPSSPGAPPPACWPAKACPPHPTGPGASGRSAPCSWPSPASGGSGAVPARGLDTRPGPGRGCRGRLPQLLWRRPLRRQLRQHLEDGQSGLPWLHAHRRSGPLEARRPVGPSRRGAPRRSRVVLFVNAYFVNNGTLWDALNPMRALVFLVWSVAALRPGARPDTEMGKVASCGAGSNDRISDSPVPCRGRRRGRMLYAWIDAGSVVSETRLTSTAGPGRSGSSPPCSFP